MALRQSRTNDEKCNPKTRTESPQKESSSSKSKFEQHPQHIPPQFVHIRGRLDNIRKNLGALRDKAPALSMAVVVDGVVVWCTGVGQVYNASKYILLYTTAFIPINAYALPTDTSAYLHTAV